MKELKATEFNYTRYEIPLEDILKKLGIKGKVQFSRTNVTNDTLILEVAK